MTTVVLGDIGGDILESCWSSKEACKHTRAHVRSLLLSLTLFLHKKSISVLPCSPSHPSSCVCSFPFNLGGVVSFLKFLQVKWQVTSRPLWCFKKLLSHSRPPSVSQFVPSCPFCFSFLSPFLFFSTANIEGDLIDKRCSISQQISSFVCLWLCPKSFSMAASSSTWCFSEDPLAHKHTHTHLQ